jgi:hypothetical protein
VLCPDIVPRRIVSIITTNNLNFIASSSQNWTLHRADTANLVLIPFESLKRFSLERQAFVFSFGALSYDPTPITSSTDFSFQIASAQRDRLQKSACGHLPGDADHPYAWWNWAGAVLFPRSTLPLRFFCAV